MGGRIKPMSDVGILREMLVCNNHVQVPLQQDGKTTSAAELIDNQANIIVKIRGLPRDSIVIRAENFKTRLCVFKGLRSERKCADFVIVSNDERTGRWVVYIEVQAGDVKNKDHITNQLKGAVCVMKYCQCVGKQFWLEKEFLNDYKRRFVSMVHTAMNKKSIPPDNITQQSWDNPEDFLKLHGDYHYFNKLIHITG